MTPWRAAWFGLGAAALGVGSVGVFVPLLPTTPFILLAAFAFARSSQRWHDWLVDHPLFGRAIADWRAHGAIGRPAKCATALAIALTFAVSFVIHAPLPVLICQALVMIGVAAFIVSRPIPPKRARTAKAQRRDRAPTLVR